MSKPAGGPQPRPRCPTSLPVPHPGVLPLRKPQQKGRSARRAAPAVKTLVSGRFFLFCTYIFSLLFLHFSGFSTDVSHQAWIMCYPCDREKGRSVPDKIPGVHVFVCLFSSYRVSLLLDTHIDKNWCSQRNTESHACSPLIIIYSSRVLFFYISAECFPRL